jgi:hypothetical protein
VSVQTDPFPDGNSHISRLLMNGEPSRCARCRVIIPSLFHEKYVDAQLAMTRCNNPQPAVRALNRIALWSTRFDCKDLHQVAAAMKRADAFEDDPNPRPTRNDT